ncbi:MAG: hypothetical protein KA170_08675 [Candidatus Promineofilum sp.]|nr:hypothetical protein [Promineifilum sp.]
MAQEDDLHDEIPPRPHETPGVKVYDRPPRALPPAWLLILLALLVLAGVWLAFTYLS